MGQRPAIFIENDFSEKNTGGVAHSLQLDAYVELFENGEYLTPLLP